MHTYTQSVADACAVYCGRWVRLLSRCRNQLVCFSTSFSAHKSSWQNTAGTSCACDALISSKSCRKQVHSVVGVYNRVHNCVLCCAAAESAVWCGAADCWLGLRGPSAVSDQANGRGGEAVIWITGCSCAGQGEAGYVAGRDMSLGRLRQNMPCVSLSAAYWLWGGRRSCSGEASVDARGGEGGG